MSVQKPNMITKQAIKYIIQLQKIKFGFLQQITMYGNQGSMDGKYIKKTNLKPTYQ